MATNVPDGYYLGKNGRLYPSKRKSLAERFEEDSGKTKEELLGVDTSRVSFLFGRGFEERVAPTEAKGKTPPRAMTVGYHRAAQLLAIEFRPKGTVSNGIWTASESYGPIFCFADVTEDDWDNLISRGSTGKWLLANPEIEERREAFEGEADIQERVREILGL